MPGYIPGMIYCQIQTQRFTVTSSSNRIALIRATLKYETRDELIRGMSPLVSRGGLFIRTKATRPVGTEVHFEFKLADESQVFTGEGIVRREIPFDAENPGQVCGILLGLKRINRQFDSVIKEILAQKAAQQCDISDDITPVPTAIEDSLKAQKTAEDSESGKIDEASADSVKLDDIGAIPADKQESNEIHAAPMIVESRTENSSHGFDLFGDMDLDEGLDDLFTEASSGAKGNTNDGGDSFFDFCTDGVFGNATRKPEKAVVTAKPSKPETKDDDLGISLEDAIDFDLDIASVLEASADDVDNVISEDVKKITSAATPQAPATPIISAPPPKAPANPVNVSAAQTPAAPAAPISAIAMDEADKSQDETPSQEIENAEPQSKERFEAILQEEKALAEAEAHDAEIQESEAITEENSEKQDDEQECEIQIDETTEDSSEPQDPVIEETLNAESEDNTESIPDTSIDSNKELLDGIISIDKLNSSEKDPSVILTSDSKDTEDHSTLVGMGVTDFPPISQSVAKVAKSGSQKKTELPSPLPGLQKLAPLSQTQPETATQSSDEIEESSEDLLKSKTDEEVKPLFNMDNLEVSQEIKTSDTPSSDDLSSLLAKSDNKSHKPSETNDLLDINVVSEFKMPEPPAPKQRKSLNDVLNETERPPEPKKGFFGRLFGK